MVKSISFKQGEAKILTLTVTDAETGASIDLSEANLSLGFKKQKTDDDYIFSKVDDDFDKSQAADGIISVNLTAEDTNQDPWPYIGELRANFTANSIVKSADLTINIELAIT